MKSSNVFFKYWAVPDGAKNVGGTLCSDSLHNVFNESKVTLPRKNGFELTIRHLKNTESAVLCTIDDLNVLHSYSAASAKIGGFQRNTGLRAAAVSSRRRRGAKRGAPSNRAV